MPSKRRNNGRSKKNKGHSNVINCANCGRIYPKDKAIKRFQARNLVDGSSRRDIKENFAYDQADFNMPKIYVKTQYCVSCAIHSRTVRVRSVVSRKTRYTTKLRNVKRDEAKSGSAAIPLFKLLGRPQQQHGQAGAAGAAGAAGSA